MLLQALDSFGFFKKGYFSRLYITRELFSGTLKDQEKKGGREGGGIISRLAALIGVCEGFDYRGGAG